MQFCRMQQVYHRYSRRFLSREIMSRETSKKCRRFLGYHYSRCGISCQIGKIAQIILFIIFKMHYVNNVLVIKPEGTSIFKKI